MYFYIWLAHSTISLFFPYFGNGRSKMADDSKLNNKGISRLALALAALVLYNVLLTAFAGYAAYYAINRFEHLQNEVDECKTIARQVRISNILVNCWLVLWQ